MSQTKCELPLDDATLMACLVKALWYGYWYEKTAEMVLPDGRRASYGLTAVIREVYHTLQINRLQIKHQTSLRSGQ